MEVDERKVRQLALAMWAGRPPPGYSDPSLAHRVAGGILANPAAHLAALKDALGSQRLVDAAVEAGVLKQPDSQCPDLYEIVPHDHDWRAEALVTPRDDPAVLWACDRCGATQTVPSRRPG